MKRDYRNQEPQMLTFTSGRPIRGEIHYNPELAEPGGKVFAGMDSTDAYALLQAAQAIVEFSFRTGGSPQGSTKPDGATDKQEYPAVTSRGKVDELGKVARELIAHLTGVVGWNPGDSGSMLVRRTLCEDKRKPKPEPKLLIDAYDVDKDTMVIINGNPYKVDGEGKLIYAG